MNVSESSRLRECKWKRNVEKDEVERIETTDDRRSSCSYNTQCSGQQSVPIPQRQVRGVVEQKGEGGQTQRRGRGRGSSVGG